MGRHTVRLGTVGGRAVRRVGGVGPEVVRSARLCTRRTRAQTPGALVVLTSTRSVLVVRVLLHVDHPQSLRLLHVRPTVLRSQAAPFLSCNISDTLGVEEETAEVAEAEAALMFHKCTQVCQRELKQINFLSMTVLLNSSGRSKYDTI